MILEYEDEDVAPIDIGLCGRGNGKVTVADVESLSKRISNVRNHHHCLHKSNQRQRCRCPLALRLFFRFCVLDDRAVFDMVREVIYDNHDLIETLDLQRSPVAESDVVRLVGATCPRRLKHLSLPFLRSTGVFEIFQAIPRGCELESFGGISHEVSPQPTQEIVLSSLIAQNLQNHENLKSLSLSLDYMSDQSMSLLVDTVLASEKQQRSLQSMSLRSINGNLSGEALASLSRLFSNLDASRQK